VGIGYPRLPAVFKNIRKYFLSGYLAGKRAGKRAGSRRIFFGGSGCG